jgi:hypothetical protein
MTIKNLINSEILKLPLIRNEEDFPDYIRKTLQNYLSILNSSEGRLSDTIKSRIDLIMNLSYGLIDAVEEYYLGHVYKAYKSFSTSVSSIKKYLFLQSSINLLDNQNRKISEEFYFKIRVGHRKTFSKTEMFIRPFNHRENIQTYRYSIPGLPCLYLSNNIITAWFELGCPEINSLQIARFELSNNLKKLYFGDIKQLIDYSEDKEGSTDQLLVNYLTYFPLHAVCTVKTKNEESIFKPEYIFPQLLMQWVHDENIDMIEYMSTQITYEQITKKSFFQFHNIAIPAQCFQKDGQCEILKSKINLTETITWQEIAICFPNILILQNTLKDSMNFYRLKRGLLEIELIKGKSTKYDSTIFGILEDYLIDEMQASHVDT